LFERLCLVNTLLFAGFDGYRVKLWIVDPDTADYAGLYSWRSAEEAEVYARYIVGVLSPSLQPVRWLSGVPRYCLGAPCDVPGFLTLLVAEDKDLSLPNADQLQTAGGRAPRVTQNGRMGGEPKGFQRQR
jgi:hypothetical protein